MENIRTLTDADITAIKNAIICDELKIFRRLLKASGLGGFDNALDRYAAKEIETRGGDLSVF